MVLRRCFLEKRRIVVMIRRVNSIRGTCSGFLKAFDKHMNLVLLDVTELFLPFHQYRRFQLENSDKLETGAVFRDRKLTHRQFSKQLFIRGDNVVMIYEEPARRKK